MSRSARRDPLVTDTAILQQSTDQYIAVMRDGTIASENADAYGITMASGDEGDPVPVCRLGFVPVIGVTAANISDKTEFVVAANGHVDIIPTSGGGTGYVIGRAEEDLNADGAQFGAFVDCLTAGRGEDIPA